MAKILFICHGNVGRSQIAQAYYNNYTNSDDAISAGIDSSTPEKYPNLDDMVHQVMLEEGIDIKQNGQFVKTLEEYMLEDVDQIYILCDKTLCPDFLIKSDKIIYWNIPDPYGKGIENMRTIRNMIKEKVYSVLT